jgi:hypothetical protein
MRTSVNEILRGPLQGSSKRKCVQCSDFDLPQGIIDERLPKIELGCGGSTLRNNSKVMDAVNAGHLVQLLECWQ